MKLSFYKILASFLLLAATAHGSVSAAAGNAAGISPDSGAPDSPPGGPDGGPDGGGGSPQPPTNGGGIDPHSLSKKLRTPEITEIRRLDENNVRIKWKCAPPVFDQAGMQCVNVKILRQSYKGDWTLAKSQAWAATGECVDAARANDIWRYSAIMTYEFNSPGTPDLDTASDAAVPIETEYVKCFYGILGFRQYQVPYHWAPPGRDIEGTAPRDDWFRIIIKSSDGKSPAFIAINPGLAAGAEAPLTFTAEGKRYFPAQEPIGFYTEHSTEGYIVRQRPFIMQADARVTGFGDYVWCLTEISEIANSPSPERKGIVGEYPNKKYWFQLPQTSVEVLGTRYYGEEKEGFDNATYFASQHLRGGVSAAEGKRHVKLQYEGERAPYKTFPIPLVKTGPFDISNETFTFQDTNQKKGDLQFDLLATTSALDESGIVKETHTDRELKTITLEPKAWTIGIYPVAIYDSRTDELHEPPDLPDPAALQSYLNRIYGKQANVTFQVILKAKFTIDTLDCTPSRPDYPLSVSSMKSLLWNASTKEDFTLFWVNELEPGFAGFAFASPSQGAVIGPSGDFSTVAHELGHCFGLKHCWQLNADSSLGKIADQESKRLMGYAGGELLRSAEIIKVNKWTKDAVLSPINGNPNP